MDARKEVVVEFAVERLKTVLDSMRRYHVMDCEDTFVGYYRTMGAMKYWIEELEKAVKELSEVVK